MASPRRIRTGREELERLREQRERMQNTMKIVSMLAEGSGLDVTPPKSSGALLEGQNKYTNPIGQFYDSEYRKIHDQLGAAIGSSMRKGSGYVGDVVSPGIRRDQNTGARVKPYSDLSPIGPEYEYEKKYMKAPGSAAYSAGLKFNTTNAPLQRARETGSEVARMRRELSRMTADSINSFSRAMAASSGESFEEKRAQFVGFLQNNAEWQSKAATDKEKVTRTGLGDLGLYPRDLARIGGTLQPQAPSTMRSAVNPSGPAKPVLKPLAKSPIEPRTQSGSQGIPEIFKKSFGSGGLGSVSFAGPALLGGGENPGGDISDWKNTQSVMGVSRATFTARNVLASIKNPALSPEQKYTIWQRFGPKRFR